MNDKEQSYIDLLQNEMFAQGRSSEETMRCVRYAEGLLEAGLPVLFDRKHVLRTLRLPESYQGEYHRFSLSQGVKERTITAPSRQLKRRQRWILREILSVLQTSPYAHGFEPGRSIKTHAALHADKDYVLCLDIRDFFLSISQDRVKKVFQSAGYSPSAAGTLAKLCCFEEVLPQGAPTSPRLSSIIFKELDLSLAHIAEKWSAVYSRYADDLTFSAPQAIDGLLNEAEQTLRSHGFFLNQEKIRFYGPEKPKRITGLVVQNGTLSVPKHFKRQLRQEIYYCSKFGVLTHLENTGASKQIHYREHLYGKAYFIHMIEPEAGKNYLQALDQIHWP